MGFDRTRRGGAAAAKVAGLGVAALLAGTIAVAPGQAWAAEGTEPAPPTEQGDIVEGSASGTAEQAPQQGGAPSQLQEAPVLTPAASNGNTALVSTPSSSIPVGNGADKAAPTAAGNQTVSAAADQPKATGQKAAPSSGTPNEDVASADTNAAPAPASGTQTHGADASASNASPQAETASAQTAAQEPASQAPDVPAASVPASVEVAPSTAPAASESTAPAEATLSSAEDASTTSEVMYENVYRLYNPWSGEHLYTASFDEARNLFSIGWRWEDIAYQASTSTGKAVYRLYNPYAGNHLYTLDRSEADHLSQIGWNFEDVAWYSLGDGSLFRLYNPWSATGEHLYTNSESERDTASRAGWIYEGIAWGITPGFVSVQGQWVISPAYGSPERYWIQSNGQLAKGRYIEPEEGTGYSVAAYARPDGAVVRGTWYDGGNHVYLADGDGRLANQSEGWLVTSAYDGKDLQRYRMDGLGRAKVGEFNVDGKDYLGRTDTGYVVRGTYFWGDERYIANNDGVIQSKMSRKQIYVEWAKGIAADNSHGYSQINRWGPNYDCSALVISALRQAGYQTGAANSTRDMRRELTRYGWQVVAPSPRNLQYGDILLHDGVHTAIYCGNGQLVEAWEDENGSWQGYRSGDQTGQEIRVRSYYDDGWLCYLRHA